MLTLIFPDRAFNYGKKHLLLMMAGLMLASSATLLAAPPRDADVPPSFQEPLPITPPPTDPTPAGLYGNYAGAGKCPPGAAKSCTDTGTLDNLFLQRLDKVESKEEVWARGLTNKPKTDTQVSIRILRDHGHSCTLKGEMYWSGDHLEFLDKPPAARTVYSRCDLQLWFKDGNVTIKDPRNECAEKLCFYGKPVTLAGRQFKQGPDPLLIAPKKPAPPPAAIFGTYKGTGQCPTDERKQDLCMESKDTDFIVIDPSDTADARVTLGNPERAGVTDYFCLRDAEAVWLGNHLAFVKEMPDSPGRPHLVQFWFKGDTVVVRNVWNNHCGTYIQGGVFKKLHVPPNRVNKR